MGVYENLIVLFILFVMAILFYCKLMNKSLVDLFKELKEIFSMEEIKQ